MTLRVTVIDIVDELGRATLDDVIPVLARKHVSATRDQVKHALGNAKFTGQLETVGLAERKGQAPALAIYAIARPKRTSIPRVSSVWELGAALHG